MLRKIQRAVHRELDPTARPVGLSFTNQFVVGLILIAVVLAIVETEQAIYAVHQQVFELAEYTLTWTFTLEYVARLWSIALTQGDMTEWRKRLRFATSPSGLIDLLVLIAAWTPMFTANLAMLRIVRLARIFRLAKLGRFSRAAEHLQYAVRSRAYELMLSVSLALMLLVAGATALYWVEGDIQPDKFGSIPRALWWAAVTLTTIGYGDVSPVTPLGKFIAVLVAVAGIGLVAMPTGILASGFSEAVGQGREREDK